ncbi:unnamed protein product [Dovyalis caffra]|uniref:endo-polygalacturonase n=1 Tax=Dovyalis caffra TaxID=77055 RepID=A0AAV1RCU4_9ROSI|nr:unnamed protein product [Dovyalis caffra]
MLSSTTTILESYIQPHKTDTIYAKNRTLDSFVKSGHVSLAQKLFDEMPICDVVTYNLMISGLGKYGISRQALYYYYEMVSLGIKETPSTFSSVLSICSSRDGLFRAGIQVHCRVIKFGYGSNSFISSSLVGFYMQMGFFDFGLSLFNEMPGRNLATWNLVLRGFCELGLFHELLGVYRETKLDGVKPNGLTFCYLIRGCCNERFFDEGKQLHCHVFKVGWAGSNIFVANALVDFYSACKILHDASKSFESIMLEDVLSWNSIVAVYADRGLLFEALELFYMMQFWGKRPSIRSFVALLNFSSITGSILFGKQIHCCVLKMGFDIGSFHVQSALIDMYGKCRDIESSVSTFESVPGKTTESCNSLMTSLLHCGIVDDVVEMYGLMVDEGIGLDEVTFSTTLKALSVSAFASLDSCRLVHCCAMKLGFESNIAVSCCLIDAYSRSGHVQLSKKVFEQLPSPNVICFTSIINGLARNGLGRECLRTFEVMIQKGLEPDKVTFLCVLTGCSHSGLVEDGRLIFYSMKAIYGICPAREHFSCMVDLLGRAGLLDEAEELLQQAPGRGDCVMWTSLLRSCRIYRNEILGRRAAKALLELDPEDFAVYLQVSNFYSDIGEYETSMHIRELAVARKMTREIVAHGVAGNMACNSIGNLEKLKNFDIEEVNETELSDVPSWTSERGAKVLVNVDSFGAVGDGVSDDTQAFENAWNTACTTPKSVFLVPPGQRYLVNATRFKGPCVDTLLIQIDATIMAPDEPKNWEPNFARLWLGFFKLNGVVFQGNGVIDGSGSKWWASSCKKNNSNPCRGAPTALTIDSSSNVKVQGLTIQNSQQMHFVISRSDSVLVSGVLVSAPEGSPNTDGIHITGSTNVVLQDCKIGTGDDCISIVNGSSNIKMKRIFCGPGHGISLGKDNSTGIVTKVVLDTAFLRETTNGLRIKTWQGGHGYVRGVRFENVGMDNVTNPIIIDQFYCDSPKACQNQTSAVEISEIVYRNINGTTKSSKAMKFACSDTVPCRNIVVSNINLENKDGTVETYCNSAQGFGCGFVHPSADCLSFHDKGYNVIGQSAITKESSVIAQMKTSELSETSNEDITHTEL